MKHPFIISILLTIAVMIGLNSCAVKQQQLQLLRIGECTLVNEVILITPEGLTIPKSNEAFYELMYAEITSLDWYADNNYAEDKTDADVVRRYINYVKSLKSFEW